MSWMLAQESREIFLRLMKEQEAGTSLELSRLRMSEEFKIEVSRVIAIEQQGRMCNWPTLSGA